MSPAALKGILPATLLLVLSITGCMGSVKPVATSLNDLEADEVIVVGRIVVDPPVDGDQKLKTVAFTEGGLLINPNAGRFRNKVLLLTDREDRRIVDPSMGDYDGRIEAELGETFCVRAKREPFYVIRSEILMKLKTTGPDRVVLPSGYRIDIRPGDRAVYTGTIKYHRDEFFGTEKIELVDEYNKVYPAFRKRFGDSIVLRKAFPTVAK